MDFEKLLTPYQRQRIEVTKGKMKVDPSKLVIDMSKTPDFQASGLFIPTLLCSSRPWSESLQRWALVKERLTFQGIACYSKTSEEYECAWADLVGNEISERAALELAGNAMSVPVVGAVFFVRSGLHVTRRCGARQCR